MHEQIGIKFLSKGHTTFAAVGWTPDSKTETSERLSSPTTVLGQLVHVCTQKTDYNGDTFFCVVITGGKSWSLTLTKANTAQSRPTLLSPVSRSIMGVIMTWSCRAKPRDGRRLWYSVNTLPDNISLQNTQQQLHVYSYIFFFRWAEPQEVRFLVREIIKI